MNSFTRIILSLALLALIAMGCDNGNKQSSQAAAELPVMGVSQNIQDYPELLPRNPKIGTPDEQAKVQNIYQEIIQDLRLNSQDYRRRLQLAQLFMLEARATGEHGYYYPASLAVLDGILAENPSQDVVFGAKSLKASVYLSLHQFEVARQIAREAVTLNGYNAVIYGSLVDANVELGDYEQAVVMADKMVSIRPDLRSYSRVSYLREIHGDMDGAIEAMQQAANSGYPGFEETAWCRLTLGNLYETIGQLDNAEVEYRRILAERPEYPFAIAALAQIYMKKGDLVRAENELNRAIQSIPEVGFYEQLADLYQQTDRSEKADQTIEEIMEMLADDEAHGHQMGMEYAEVYLGLLNDPARALEYARKEYQKRPANIDANRQMAEVLYQLGRVDEAEKHIKKATRTGSQNPRLLCVAGLIKYDLGEKSEGRALITQSFELDPYQSHALVNAAKDRIDE